MARVRHRSTVTAGVTSRPATAATKGRLVVASRRRRTELVRVTPCCAEETFKSTDCKEHPRQILAAKIVARTPRVNPVNAEFTNTDRVLRITLQIRDGPHGRPTFACTRHNP